MENPAIQKFPVLFTAVIAFILLLTVGLACMSGGDYVDLLLRGAILIVLITIALKVMFEGHLHVSRKNKHE